MTLSLGRRFDIIELSAALGRTRDTIATASFLCKADDKSQLMRWAAQDLAMIARTELRALLEMFEKQASEGGNGGNYGGCC